MSPNSKSIARGAGIGLIVIIGSILCQRQGASGSTGTGRLGTVPRIPRERRVIPAKTPGWPAAREVVRWTQRAEAEGDPLRREELLRFADESVALEDIGDLLAKMPPENSNEFSFGFGKRLLRRLAAADLPAARRLAEGLSAGPWRESVLECLAICGEPTDAAQWASGLPNEPERVSAVLTVAYEMIRNDPQGALQLALALPQDPQRDEALAQAAMEWTTGDPVAATNWAKGLEDIALRESLLGAIAVAWSDQDPEAGATLVAEDLSEGRGQNDAVVSIISRWVQMSPDGAAEWVARFPEGPLKRMSGDTLEAIRRSPLMGGGKISPAE